MSTGPAVDVMLMPVAPVAVIEIGPAVDVRSMLSVAWTETVVAAVTETAPSDDEMVMPG